MGKKVVTEVREKPFQSNLFKHLICLMNRKVFKYTMKKSFKKKVYNNKFKIYKKLNKQNLKYFLKKESV